MAILKSLSLSEHFCYFVEWKKNVYLGTLKKKNMEVLKIKCILKFILVLIPT